MIDKRKVPEIRFKGFDGEWEEKRFEENIVSIQTGTNLLGTASNTGMPLLKMGNIQRGYFSLDKVEFLDKNAEVEKRNLVIYGDFFFNTRNTLDLVGKGATWTGESGKFAFNSNIARFVFSGVDNMFFNYLYNTQSMINQVRARAMGTTSVAAIYPKSLNSLEYRLPACSEQSQIGTFFKNLDALITLHQRKYVKLTTVKKAMLEKMFPKDGADVPEIRFKGFTEKWERRKLGSIYSKIRNAFVGTATPYYVEDGHFYLESNNVKNGMINRKTQIFINDEFYQRQKDGWLRTGDLVMVQSGHVGHSAVIPPSLDKTAAHALIFFTDLKYDVNPHFINYQLQTASAAGEIEKITTGNTIKHILSSDMKEFFVSMTILEEQDLIASYFIEIDSLITLQQRELDKLKNIKKACLEKMFV